MPGYRVPLDDIRFVLNDVLDLQSHYATFPAGEAADADTVDAILDEGAKFAERELSPLNQTGDAQGCEWRQGGDVITPEGFKEAYQLYIESGWPSLAHPEDWGGQGLPSSLGMTLSEMIGTANWAWSMYPGLSHGATYTIETHGSDEQKKAYLEKLVSGEWTGTMCLTEPHCGTDLGLLRTRAEPQDDGSYRLFGNKIFISAGEHDMADNIVHIVLARLPDAPEGVKGISLFIVPKFNLAADGVVGERNGVTCGSIEHKMGIHGNATAALNFDGAIGYLIGPPNEGLKCMFTFMNFARIGTALQGVAHAEWAFQNSLEYARERLQMRSLSGTKAPEKAADPIIVHPDVRRMLLTQKAIAEGGRAFIYYLAVQADLVEHGKSAEEREHADQVLGFLTPIAKAFLTETGYEAANHGLQVFGGHGYVREWGMEQNVRDARISMLYEGTTGIQALDLLGRKILMDKGEAFKAFRTTVSAFCKAHKHVKPAAPHLRKLRWMLWEWSYLTLRVGYSARQDKDAVGAASVEYLMYSGYITLAFFWAMSAVKAAEKLEAGEGDVDFMQAKLDTAAFYFDRLLPRTRGLKAAVLNGPDTLMAPAAEHFGR
ncbi:MAG: acyl-CoA dehydrogenase C-terminal domain-containing protein [Pseudomonadota bacterium]